MGITLYGVLSDKMSAVSYHVATNLNVKMLAVAITSQTQ